MNACYHLLHALELSRLVTVIVMVQGSSLLLDGAFAVPGIGVV